MNVATKITPGTDLLAAVENDTSVVLVNAEAFEAWLIDLRAKVEGLDADVTVRKNREAIREAAAEIGRKKASVERDRLRLTKEWRDLTAKVNAAGKDINEKLEGLQAEVRAPLTAWEEREKLRVSNCERLIAEIKASGIVGMDDTSETVRDRGTEVYLTKIDHNQFGELYETAVAAKDTSIAALKAALARLIQEEADKAELEKLRAEKDEREKVEAEQKAKAERDAAEVAEIERQKARIAAEEQARKDREEQIAREAAEHAQREADARHAAELQAERDRAAEIERAAQEERDRVKLAEEVRERIAAAERAEVQRIADQKIADEKNRALQRRLKTEAKDAIMSCGVSEEAAQKIVLAIRAREIPHVEWRVAQ